MIEQIEALNKIASDFSNFAKPIDEEFYPLDLNELAASVADFYAQDRHMVFVTKLHPDPLMVNGVKEELRRVLVNLIKNAKEAIDKGGRIVLHTYADANGRTVSFTVTDNGAGIPAEDQDRIFVPNFSTKTSGTGLGLAISKKIVEEHNGEITFISTTGEGTSFTVSLPVSESK